MSTNDTSTGDAERDECHSCGVEEELYPIKFGATGRAEPFYVCGGCYNGLIGVIREGLLAPDSDQ